MPLLEAYTRKGIEHMDSARVHEKHLLHPAVHVIVKKKNALEFYIRKRPSTKAVYPSLWTSSVGAHVLAGQDVDNAAQENLKKFLGLETALTFLGKKHVEDAVENEDVSFYVCEIDGMPQLNPEEGEQGKFMHIDQILKLKERSKVTPHLITGLYMLGYL